LANQDAIGKTYDGGDAILRQGKPNDRMFVVQSGMVEVVHEEADSEVRLSTLGEGDFFGEVPFFERVNSQGIARVTVRAVEESRVLTVDKKTIVRRIHEDPSLAYKILQIMSRRIRELEKDMIKLLISE
jgi:CRP/FNR family cyclic AMP-dependent transcriptional regulator